MNDASAIKTQYNNSHTKEKTLGSRAMSHLRTPPTIHLPKMPFHTAHPYHQTSSSTSSTTSTFQPTAPQRQPTLQTQYMRMLLALDDISRVHNILASFFTWLLLAGFVIFPGTFTSLSTSDTVASSTTASTIIHSVQHIPLLVIATVSSALGATGMLYLYYAHTDNFVWLLNKIFLPGVLHSLAGLISTLVNVYSSQKGMWSVSARVTAGVTGGCMVICGALFGVYQFWALEKVKKEHGKEMEAGQSWTEKLGRGRAGGGVV
ncbi:uncharacterized protein BP5553_05050 [Venustampulla echinocandica]|uniref:Uncharacterized protein n=1 Tax=Venustampulla echinocandica TaxID=2656787 RepID=A0A370TQ12_9HELO|nr:uncharacterized protein BP5553_05050 [Venustampulla echinocandica]RDL37617.1 hypothetical protein BP5553_05050 [Venustampulla echinocandica]